jgi:predicted HD phosphohydrolase
MDGTVSFTRMQDGTAEEYALLGRIAKAHVQATLTGNVLAMLKRLEGPAMGYKIDRYQHSLQSATRALKDGAAEEMVVAALLHDIGDVVAPENHSALAAAVLRPYVGEETHWVIQHHGVFQGYYYFDKIGQDKDAREAFRGHPHFQACADFCEKWDQTSFDPDYPTEPLSTFEPMVHRLFAKEPKGFV